MPRGGKRAGAGRKPTTLAVNKEFAHSVLLRIKELKLRGVRTAEDYALQLLKSRDIRIRKEVFIDLINREHGKPIQKQEVSGVDGSSIRVVVEHIGGTAKNKAPTKTD